MPSWLKKAKQKYTEYKAKAPEREKVKRTKVMKDLRTKTAFAEQRAKLTEQQAKVEAAKTRISKSKSARPSVFGSTSHMRSGSRPGSSGGGFHFKPAPPTDMWGTPLKTAAPKALPVKRAKRRKKRK